MNRKSSNSASREVLATKWRQHVAVGVSPQDTHPRNRQATKWRQQMVAQELLSPLRGYVWRVGLFCGLTPAATCCRHFVTGLLMLLSLTTLATATDGTNQFDAAKSIAQTRIAKVFGAKVGRTPGYATGIIVSNNGQILTANGTHLNGDRIRVVLPDGSSHLATPERRSRKQQLAVLKIDHATPAFFDLSKPATAYKGQWVLSFSNLFKIADGSDAPSMMLGIVSLKTKLEAKRGNQPFPYEGDVYLLDTISSNPGSPGGALVDAQSGELVGMIGPNLESRSSGTKLNYAIPVGVLSGFVEGTESVPDKKVMAANARPFLGIRLFRVGGKRSPAYIDRVKRGSPAAKAKLRTDDVILGIGDERIKSIAQYDEVFAKLKPGVEVDLAVKRGQKLMTISVVPEAAK